MEVEVGPVRNALRTPRDQWEAFYSSQFVKFINTYGAPTTDTHATHDPPTTAVERNRAEASAYQLKLLEAVELGLKSLFIDIQDIRMWSSEGDDLSSFVQKYYFDIAVEIDDMIENFAKETIKEFAASDTVSQRHEDMYRECENFCVCFYGASYVNSVRTLRCDTIGELTTLRATVTRTSDIRPELRLASFECDTCGCIVDKVEQQFKYTEPSVCPRKECGNRFKWNLKQDTCQFSDWQKIRVQENASEIPAGGMPRTVDVIVRNDVCDRCKAGDRVLITGCLIAVPDVPSLMKPGDVPKAVARDKTRHERTEFGMLDNTIRGLRNLGVRDLGYRLCFLGTHIKVLTAVADSNDSNAGISRHEQQRGPFAALSATKKDLFTSIANSSRCLDTLAAHIAPEVYGHENIKKGLLLLLVSGVEKSTEKEEIKLRGDINACIVGDPGTAKSQLLKFIQGFVGQSVYTSGKSSTSAGLTASVHRDMDQGDAVIEAGALMLADKGICCIDEFDKMDEKDVVAIHEAMEQQTISIAKAGIQATLNARASVLAACNPANGRYDLSRTFRQNVRLSAPIISRFDLFFVMIDDTDRDEIVARHMVKMHATMSAQQNGDEEFGRQELKEYIRIAKCFRPKITEEAKEVLKTAWITLRQHDTVGSTRNVRITVRQLESLIRLSEALAKLKFSDQVLQSHVEEAYQLYNNSLTKVKKGRIDFGEDEFDEFDETAGDDEFETSGITGVTGGVTGGIGTRRLRRREGESEEDYERREEVYRTELVIDGEEFERIGWWLVEYLREQERANRLTESGEDGAPLVITRDNLVTWYLDTHYDTDSEEDLAREYRKVIRIITRMANRDFTLIEERRPFEVPLGDTVSVEEVIVIRLHPNYSSTCAYSGFGGTRTHASLPTTYFATESYDRNVMGAVQDNNNRHTEMGGQALCASPTSNGVSAIPPQTNTYTSSDNTGIRITDEDLVALMDGTQTNAPQ